MGTKALIIGGRRSGKTAAMQAMAAMHERAVVTDEDRAAFKEKLGLRKISDDPEPPRRLSIDPNSPDFHPSYVRVGVRVDGVERNDLQWYDMDRKEYMTTAKTSHLADSIEPYWRYIETRQQRRARERWEAKRK